MKAALYARVSSEAQDTVLSLSAQIRALKEYALKNGHDVVREFIDEAESGRSADRPAFKEMIALARSKSPPFQAILVWKLSRFARSREDSVTFKALLKRHGVNVVSINEPVDDTPAGQLLEGIIESIDEFYSANLGQDIRRGMGENARRGFFNGSNAPYGFHKIGIKDGEKIRNKLEPDAPASLTIQVVRQMFEMADKDEGCKEIAMALNKKGFPTKKGERWGRTTVHKILTNECYCGSLVWGGRRSQCYQAGKEPIRIENAWPAIVDKDLFYRVQAKLKAKSRSVISPRAATSAYLLSGLLYCSCGHAMKGHKAKSGRHFYYQCNQRYQRGKDACISGLLPKDKLEKQVMENLKCRVLTDGNLGELVTLVNDELSKAHYGLKDRLDSIDLELKEISQRLKRLLDALETGSLQTADLAPRIRELRFRQDELSKTRVQVEADMIIRGYEPVDIDLVKTYAQDLKTLLEEADMVQRKAFIRSFVMRIDVDAKNITIRYKLPLPGSNQAADVAVLPSVTFGGDGGESNSPSKKDCPESTTGLAGSLFLAL